jgi:hypothetical protein
MKTLSAYLIILALSCYALACSVQNKAEGAKPSLVGEYQYSGFNQKGEKIVKGRLTITSVEDKRIYSETVTQIKGNWQFDAVGNTERIGKQTGSGELVGSIKNGEITIDLNPNISDANVILRGKLDGKRFHGSWSFHGYAGVLSEGTFEAIRK